METVFELLNNRILKAYKEASNAIYFNDSSDYIDALYNVCKILSPSVDVNTIGTKYME